MLYEDSEVERGYRWVEDFLDICGQKQIRGISYKQLEAT